MSLPQIKSIKHLLNFAPYGLSNFLCRERRLSRFLNHGSRLRVVTRKYRGDTLRKELNTRRLALPVLLNYIQLSDALDKLVSESMGSHTTDGLGTGGRRQGSYHLDRNDPDEERQAC